MPLDPIDGEPVWMAVATSEIAVELGSLRPGTTFVPLPATPASESGPLFSMATPFETSSTWPTSSAVMAATRL